MARVCAGGGVGQGRGRVSKVSQLGCPEVRGKAVGSDSGEKWCYLAGGLAATDDPLVEAQVIV